MTMAVIKNNELKSMPPKEAEAKITELEKAILELHGEGKREKIKPLRRTIAKLKTIIRMAPPIKTAPSEEKKPKV